MGLLSLNRISLMRSAIEDLNLEIDYDPDKADNYRKRADYQSQIVQSDFPCNQFILKNAAQDYRTCISKDPTEGLAWLGLISMEILAEDFDEAISLYGQCANYMGTADERLARCFLGCVALILAGDCPEDTDMYGLNDPDIKIGRDLISVTGVAEYLHYLSDTKRERWAKTVPIAGLYISHCHSESQKARLFYSAGLYYEALDACLKAHDQNPDETGIQPTKDAILKRIARDRKTRAGCKAAWIKNPNSRATAEIKGYLHEMIRANVIVVLLLVATLAVFVICGFFYLKQ